MKTIIFEKYKPYSYLKKYEIFSEIMKNYSGKLDPEKCSIDLKIHELNFGDCPARPVWHYDGPNDESVVFKYKYELYLQGEGYCPTKFFLLNPKILPFGTEKEVHLAAKKYEVANPDRIYYIPYDTWNFYYSHDLHSATKSIGKETRVLIRLQQEI